MIPKNFNKTPTLFQVEPADGNKVVMPGGTEVSASEIGRSECVFNAYQARAIAHAHYLHQLTVSEYPEYSNESRPDWGGHVVFSLHEYLDDVDKDHPDKRPEFVPDGSDVKFVRFWKIEYKMKG